MDRNRIIFAPSGNIGFNPLFDNRDLGVEHRLEIIIHGLVISKTPCFLKAAI